MAVDPTNGKLYAVWSDGQAVSFSSSADQGNHWTSAVVVSHAPANTAIFPWVAAYNGVVDVVYYGTDSNSFLDENADWHVYFAQFNGLNFTQTQVNTAANHQRRRLHWTWWWMRRPRHTHALLRLDPMFDPLRNASLRQMENIRPYNCLNFFMLNKMLRNSALKRSEKLRALYEGSMICLLYD
jgi:hypothetical protein